MHPCQIKIQTIEEKQKTQRHSQGPVKEKTTYTITPVTDGFRGSSSCVSQEEKRFEVELLGAKENMLIQ